MTMREYNRYFNSMESIKDNLIRGHSYLSLFANYIIIPVSMLLRIKDKSRYYDFIKGKEFNVISQLVNNNSFYNNLGRNIVLQKDRDRGIINIIEENSELENQRTLTSLEEIYIQLLRGVNLESYEWEYRETLKETLDIISLFN